MTCRCWGATAAILWHLLGGSTLAAQAMGTLEVGVSAVRYEGFLGSGAAFASPTLRFDAPNLSLGAHANFLVFESGNRILQGLAAGGWRTPAVGGVHGELSGSAGVSAYADASRFGHALGRVLVHRSGERSGVWAGGATGRSFFGSSADTPYELELGAWTVYAGLALGATLTRTWFVDTAYTDVVATARWRRDVLELDGSAGFRAGSEGGGRGVYGELHLTLPLWNRLVALLSGGRYPSDPARGVVAARYLSLGLRITAFPKRLPPTPSLTSAQREASDEARAPFASAARLEVIPSSGGTRTIRVEAPGATSVEIAGDFTDWQPIGLQRGDGGHWEITLPIATGVHRVNVRLDGGPWLVPRGTRVEEDHFGSAVGILVIS